MNWKPSKLGAILLCVIAATYVAYATIANLQSSDSGRGELVIATAGPVSLGNDPVQFSLEGKRRNLAARLGALAPNQRVYLVLHDLYASQPPGVLYDVLLDLPPGARPQKSDIHLVGTINFDSAVSPESGAASANPNSLRSYDVTAVATKLLERKVLRDQTTITIVPSGTPAARARVSIGRIELVER
jgi:hypothetical protein